MYVQCVTFPFSCPSTFLMAIFPNLELLSTMLMFLSCRLSFCLTFWSQYDIVQ